MPGRQLSPHELQDLRDFAAQWGKIIARRSFGDAGPGTDVDFQAIEEVRASGRFSFSDAAFALHLAGVSLSPRPIQHLTQLIGDELAAAGGGADRGPPADAVTYLRNNQQRMAYPRYRQAGLPVTSSLVESLVGEFNARVKGREKFWNRPAGAEAILQVRAAQLSEDDRLARHFAQRPGCPYRRRKVA